MVSLKDLKNKYDIDAAAAAAFILMLSQLKIGEEFSSVVGTVKKTSANGFIVEVGDGAAENIIEHILKANESPDSLIFSDD